MASLDARSTKYPFRLCFSSVCTVASCLCCECQVPGTSWEAPGTGMFASRASTTGLGVQKPGLPIAFVRAWPKPAHAVVAGMPARPAARRLEGFAGRCNLPSSKLHWSTWQEAKFSRRTPPRSSRERRCCAGRRCSSRWPWERSVDTCNTRYNKTGKPMAGARLGHNHRKAT